MFEKLIDTLVLLIAALQENTAARRAETSAPPAAAAQATAQQDAAAPTQGAAPPSPPRRGKAGDRTPPPPPKAEEPPAAATPDFGGAPVKQPLPTKEQANEELVAEWTRLGGNPNAMSRINDVFAEFGVAGLIQFFELRDPPYADFMTKVKALQP